MYAVPVHSVRHNHPLPLGLITGHHLSTKVWCCWALKKEMEIPTKRMESVAVENEKVCVEHAELRRRKGREDCFSPINILRVLIATALGGLQALRSACLLVWEVACE